MQIEVANQRILLLKDQISPAQSKDIAWQKKLSAFDTLSKMTSFLSKPKDDDFTLTYSEHRYEPFFMSFQRPGTSTREPPIIRFPRAGKKSKRSRYTTPNTTYSITTFTYLFWNTVYRKSAMRTSSTRSVARVRRNCSSMLR